jgi:hypothetical protein
MSEQANSVIIVPDETFHESVTSEDPIPEIKEESVSSNDEPVKDKPEQEPEPEKKPEIKSGKDKRIDTLVAQRNIAQDKARKIAEEMDQLKAENESLKSAKHQVVEVKDDPKPKAEDFQEYSDFVESLGAWSARQEHKKWDSRIDDKIKPVSDKVEKNEQTEQERVQAEQTRIFNEKIDSGRKRYGEDYDTNIGEALGEDSPLTPTALAIVFDSDYTADLLNYFGENPDEAERISGLQPLTAAKEIGKLEVNFENPKQRKENNKQITKAKEPIIPVSSGSNPIEINLETANLADYMKATGLR